MRNENLKFLLLLALFAVLPLLVSSSFFIYLYQANQHLLSHPLAIVFFHLAAIPAMAFALIPTTFVAIASGYFFSWPGLVGILISYPLAALLGLKFGRLAQKLALNEKFFQTPKVKNLLENIRKDEFFMNIFVRLSPVLPFAMINVAISVLKLRILPFLAATMIGMFPRTFIFFMLGKDAPEILAFIQNPSPEGVYRLTPLILLIISTTGLLWIAKRTFARINQESAPVVCLQNEAEGKEGK